MTPEEWANVALAYVNFVGWEDGECGGSCHDAAGRDHPALARLKEIVAATIREAIEESRSMTTETQTDPIHEGWAVVELMGHRRIGAQVRTVQVGGTSFLRCDIPKVTREEGKLTAAASGYATQFYGLGSVYCLTPCTEAVALAAAAASQPEPVTRYELEYQARRPAEDDEPDDSRSSPYDDDFPA